MQAQAGHGDQSNGARDNVAHLLQLMLEALVVADDFPTGLVEELTLARQGKLFTGPFQQGDPQADFDGTELLADRRLSDTIQAGGAAEGAGLHQVPKNTERFHLHRSLTIIRPYR